MAATPALAAMRIQPTGLPVNAVAKIPGSKSITNRALLIAALAAGESELLGALASEDTVYMAKALEALGLRAYFETVVGGDSLPERKPHPAPILAALKHLGAAPEAALMVGDNYHDVQAARAAGVRAFAVTYGYSHKPHAELGADRLIDAMSELLPIAAAAAA